MRNILIAAVLTLSACGNVGSIIADYGPVRPTIQEHDGVAWKFYDKPEESRLMVAPRAGEIRNFPMSKWDDSALFRDAANSFLAPRGCKANTVELLARPQWEVTYTC